MFIQWAWQQPIATRPPHTPWKATGGGVVGLSLCSLTCSCHRTGSPNFVAVAIITVICKSGNVVTVTAARTKQSRAVRPSSAVHLCLISTTTRQPLRRQSQCLLVHMNMSTTRFRLYQISRKDILRQGARIVQLMSINHLWEFRSMFTDLFDPICL